MFFMSASYLLDGRVCALGFDALGSFGATVVVFLGHNLVSLYNIKFNDAWELARN